MVVNSFHVTPTSDVIGLNACIDLTALLAPKTAAPSGVYAPYFESGSIYDLVAFLCRCLLLDIRIGYMEGSKYPDSLTSLSILSLTKRRISLIEHMMSSLQIFFGLIRGEGGGIVGSSSLVTFRLQQFMCHLRWRVWNSAFAVSLATVLASTFLAKVVTPMSRTFRMSFSQQVRARMQYPAKQP